MTAKDFLNDFGFNYNLEEYDEGGFLGIDESEFERALEDFKKINKQKDYEKRDLYRELRAFGLTHEQCSTVLNWVLTSL